jgi:hypothetical protein
MVGATTTMMTAKTTAAVTVTAGMVVAKSSGCPRKN